MSNLLYSKITADFEFVDNRGKLIQLVSEGYEQVNVLHSNANVERGGHYHKLSKEAFYVVQGKVIVTLKWADTIEEFSFAEGDFFEIAPLTVHGMRFPEPCVLVALYDRPIEKDGFKDIYAEEQTDEG